MRAPLLLLAGAALSGCMRFPLSPDLPPTTQLEIRSIQSRTYPLGDVRAVMKAVLAVLQDDGFLVHYGSVDLGLLDASKSIAVTHPASFFTVPISVFGLTLFGPDVTIERIRATANVSEFGDAVRVRVNFERRTTLSSEFFGPQLVDATAVTDPKPYQEFFARLDKSLFLQTEGL